MTESQNVADEVITESVESNPPTEEVEMKSKHTKGRKRIAAKTAPVVLSDRPTRSRTNKIVYTEQEEDDDVSSEEEKKTSCKKV